MRAGRQVYNLDNVEHDVIRKQWKEPRIHFALVCAAVKGAEKRNRTRHRPGARPSG